jgi:hypothetical protein
MHIHCVLQNIKELIQLFDLNLIGFAVSGTVSEVHEQREKSERVHLTCS